jgi:16S rRNA processing protein RimM
MEFAPIGYFNKTHGIKGQLVLKIVAKLRDEFFVSELKTLFIETATGKAPHFINELKESNNGLIIGLEDVNTIEKAKSLLGKKIFIDASLLDKQEEDFNWIGFELIDKKHGSLGLIEGTSDNGSQLLITLKYKGSEIILPLVEDFIDEIDEKKKKLFYNAPEGLIDLYLETGGDEEGLI